MSGKRILMLAAAAFLIAAFSNVRVQAQTSSVFATGMKRPIKIIYAQKQGFFLVSENGDVATPNSKLAKILTYHVVPGKITTKDLKKWIKKGKGTYTAKTVQGGTLTFTEDMGKIKITDEKGGSAMITTPNVIQSNGVIQVINAVLMPS